MFLIEARCEGSAQFTSTLRLSGAYVCGVCLWCGVLCVWCGCERVYGGGCPLFFLRAEGSCAAVLLCKLMGKPHCLIASLLCSVLRMRVSVTSAGAWLVQYLLVCLRAAVLSCPTLPPPLCSFSNFPRVCSFSWRACSLLFWLVACKVELPNSPSLA